MTMLDQTSSAPADAASMRPLLENRYPEFDLLEIRGSGLWPVDYADAHFAALERSLAAMRVRFGLARVLVNLREAPVQPVATADRIAYWTDRIYREVDRVAILVASNLLAGQMKRRVMIATFAVFVSEPAARLWLRER